MSSLSTFNNQPSSNQSINSEEMPPKTAILTGIDSQTGELIESSISVWNDAGGLVVNGDRNNAVVGRIPHNTKVEVIKNKTVDNIKFYFIRSAIGEVSTLPTYLEARKKAMKERPESDWWLPADEKFLVEGWITESYLSNLR